MQPVFDGHHDALTSRSADRLADGRADGHLDLPRARAAGLAASIWAIFTPGSSTEAHFVARPGGGYEAPLGAPVEHAAAAAHATAAAGRLLALERSGALRVARTAADLDAAARDGRHAAVMHLEGAEAIDPALEALDAWHAMGLRSLGVVWSRPNAFGHGVPFRFPVARDDAPDGPGLTDAGAALVARCNALGIAVDTSHLNGAGFWDVAATSDAPLIASHSGARCVTPASRNLTDAQLDAIGASDGIVGIPYILGFLTPDGSNDASLPLAGIVAHVRHVADRIGVDHVGLGSDFDGGEIPAALHDVTGLPRLLTALADDGFDAGEIARIAWGNWRRVLGATWH